MLLISSSSIGTERIASCGGSGWSGVVLSMVLLGTEDAEGVGDFSDVVDWINLVKPVEDIVWKDEL